MTTSAHPDFTGLWRLDPGRSVLHGPPPAELRMKIAHDGLAVTQVVLATGDHGSRRRSRFNYEIGRSTTNHLDGQAVETRAGWQGATLVIESVVQTPNGALRLADHWALADDGATLIMSHPDDALAGQVTVLEREG